MKKLNVLIVPSWYPSEDNPINGLFFEQQIESLKRKGLNTSIIIPPEIIGLRKNNLKNYFKYFNRPVITNEYFNGNEIYRIKLFGITKFIWLRKIYFRFASNKIFKRYLNNNPKPDIIHAHSAPWGGIFSEYIKKKYKIPYVLAEHLTHYEDDKIPQKLLPIISKAFKNADAKLVVSPKLGNVLEIKLGDAAKPWICVPTGADEEFFEVENKAVSPKFIFLNIGMMDVRDRKGHDILLKAFADRFRNDKSTELILIGDGTRRKHFEEMASELNIKEQVCFKGTLEKTEVVKEISRCNVFVLPSKVETLGLVVIEALACGKPVIVSECNGPECFITKENGIIVENSNADMLGDAMLYMKENINNYSCDNIREQCYKNHSSARTADRIIEIYRDVLNKN